ncbi:hypothetical protein QVN49_03750 [Megasphaera hexanoica]|nr:hypothetical protein [Megasphaera hexanoica]
MDLENIDIVYCWCDGKDPDFRKRKNYFLKKENMPYDEDSVGELRFFDNEELRYSLRSLEMYAPWIHHVYIVTDRQVPKWLNTSYSKVSVIDHSQIMPCELIPVFEAAVIERYIINIPGLSEYFLYANDDMFFGMPVEPEFFFTNTGNPIVYLKPYERFEKIVDEKDFQNKYNAAPAWMRTNMNAWKLLHERYGQKEFYVSAHTIDGYKKSYFDDILKKYKKAFDQADKYRFRTDKGIGRDIFGLDMVYSGYGVAEVIKKPNFWQKHIHKSKDYIWKCYCGSENAKTRKEILRFTPYVFCVNAEAHSSEQQKKEMRDFYEMLFPNPSQFEL